MSYSGIGGVQITLFEGMVQMKDVSGWPGTSCRKSRDNWPLHAASVTRMSPPPVTAGSRDDSGQRLSSDDV